MSSAAGPDPAAVQLPHVITRDKRLDGSLAGHFRANAPPGYHVRSQSELDASLDEVLTGPVQGEPVWVVGYGKLMACTRRAGWPPASVDAGSLRRPFVVNRRCPRTWALGPLRDQAPMPPAGTGRLGFCREYVDIGMACLQRLGLKDANWTRLVRALGPARQFAPGCKKARRVVAAAEGGSQRRQMKAASVVGELGRLPGWLLPYQSTIYEKSLAEAVSVGQ